MQTQRLFALALAISLALLAACGTPLASLPPTAKGASNAAPAAPALDKLPLYFVANQGQTDSRVSFYVPGKDNTIYFAPDGLTFAFNSVSTPAGLPAAGAREAALPSHGFMEPAPKAAQRWAVKLDFVGANADVLPLGEDQTSAVFSYFKGQASQWQASVPSYAQIHYSNLWPGIDLAYTGQGNQLKYEFVVQPGADPAQIQLAYRGASSVRLTADGQLEVSTPLTRFRDATPVAYQMKNGQRVPVAMHYALNAPVSAGPAATYSYSFRLGVYDHSLPLVLDPIVLVYSGFIGGDGSDRSFAIAADSLGNAYVTGQTDSTQTTFPVNVGPDPTYNGGTALNGDAFVAKVNAAGTALVYAGYIGGSSDDAGLGIAVDTDGNAYVTGITLSNQTTFPVKIGPKLTYSGGSQYGDAFVAKVNAAGTALIYAGYIGGSGEEVGSGIAVDGAGNAYVTGYTNSSQATFPVKVGPGLTFSGGAYDAFVAKVNAAGTALDYAGYIGGAGQDYGNGIAVDSLGNAYVAGQTDSAQTTFPVKVGPSLALSGVEDAFVAKVNTAGTALVYAGYIGGELYDFGYGIAVDSHGNAYVTGATASNEASFPVKVGPKVTYNGGSFDAFVAKVNAAGAALVYAGYIGGSGNDQGLGIAVDSTGNAYVAGYTDSDQTTFPVSGGPDLTANGGIDAFVAKVNTAGTSLGYAGFIGGAADDYGRGIALGAAGKAYVTGYTNSALGSFPVLVGPSLTYNGGFYDAFVAKVSDTFVPTAFLRQPLVQN